jgi:hypothetical protein
MVQPFIMVQPSAIGFAAVLAVLSHKRHENIKRLQGKPEGRIG